MKVAVIYNRPEIKDSDVINVFGMQTKERYSPHIIEKVASALEKGGHNVRIVQGNMHVIDELQTFMPRVVRGERPGMVFNMAYGIQGQSRYTHIPSMLEMLGIPYVGSGPSGHAIALDKVMSKIVFLRHNLPTPAFRVFSSPNENLSHIKYPVIVKPRSEAVSFGLRVVHNKKSLREAIAFITEEFEQQVLIEEFISGREFGVALLGNESNLETLPIVEIDLGGDPAAIQTVDDKLQHPRQKICPADIPSGIANELCRLAREAFNALDLCDFARVDFRMDEKGQLHILEINSMASLNLTGSFVYAAQVAGLDFTALVNRILDVAAIRYFGESYADELFQEEKLTTKVEPLHAQIRSYIRSHISTTVDHIEHLVSMNTHVYNIDEVNTLGNWISKRFRQLGFHRHVYPQIEVGHILYFTNHQNDHNDILLLGHMDIVYDYQNYFPFKEEHGRIYGSGVAESKGGIAVILTALQALRFARVLKKINCGILLTSDDSLGGRFSKSIINKIAHNSKYVIGTKYGDVNGGIVTSCSGAQQYQIEISNNKNNKNRNIINVVENISKKNLAWLNLSSAQRGIWVIINSVTAQTNPGRNSDNAITSLTVRFGNKRQADILEGQIRKIAEEGTDGSLHVRIRVGERRLPVRDTKTNRKFLDEVQRLAKMLEIFVEPVHREFSADICHVPENVPVLGGFGPIGGDCQSPNEYIMRDSLIDRTTLIALVIHNCAK